MKKFLLSTSSACTIVLVWQASAFGGEAGVINSEAVPETVVITASPFAQNPLDVAASVSQITHQELIVSGGIGIGDALKNVPGVTTSGFGAGSSRPVIRGLSSTRVRITENGIGGHDTSDLGDDHAVPIDPLASIQVEVLRGPATLRYGSSAIGGVVNAINNRIPIDVSEGRALEGIAGVSSNGIERLGGGIADYRQGNWAFHADGLIRGADDYETPDGTQLNSFAFGRSYAVGGAYIGDGGSAAGLGFNQSIAHYGSPTEPGSDEVSHVELDTKNYNGSVRLNSPLPGIMRLTAQGGYTDYAHDEISDSEGPLAHFANKEWETRIEALHLPFGPITTGAIGVQFGNRDFSVTGLESDFLHPTKTDSFAAYIFEEIALSERFSIQGAARAEWTGVTGDTDALGFFDRKFTPVSYALGAVFKPTGDTSLFANASWTARAPNPVELFAQGAHDASHTFETGDPNLTLEKAFSIEGGVKHQALDGSTASFSIYRTKFDGFIDGFLTGNSCDEEGNCGPPGAGDFDELFYRQSNAEFWGFEAQAHWHLFDIGNGRGGIDLQADYVRATLDDLGNVPRIPPLRYGGGLFYETDDVELSINVLHASEQDKVEAHETTTDGYTTLGASAVFHVYRGEAGDVDIALIGSNLTDSVQRNAVSFNKDFVLQPGRTFRLMLHVLR
jgi:iron complex outermembrane receptor protein